MATRSGPFYSAFLDANVIRGMATTDAILTLSEEGMFEVRWSDQALMEARRNRPEGLEEGRFNARVRQMNSAFPEARVQGFEHLLIDVPADSKDQPILLAAMHARATTLVTENGKHFWPGMADDNAMLCMSVSDFLRGALLRDQARVVSALSDRVSNNRRPPHTFSDYLDRIVHIQELSVFARALNQAVPERMRGSDPRLRRPAIDAKPSTRALAGMIPISEGLEYERRRSSRYPQARQWASGRGSRNSGAGRYGAL